MSTLFLNILFSFNVLSYASSEPLSFCNRLLGQLSENPQILNPNEMANVEKWGIESVSIELDSALEKMGAKPWKVLTQEKIERLSRVTTFSASADFRVLALSLNPKHRMNFNENRFYILYTDPINQTIVSTRFFDLNPNHKLLNLNLTAQAHRIYAHVEVVDDHQNKIGEKLIVYNLLKSQEAGSDILGSLNPKLISWLPTENNMIRYALVRLETSSQPTVMVYKLDLAKGQFDFLSYINIKNQSQEEALVNYTNSKHPTAGFARLEGTMIEVIGPESRLKLDLKKNNILTQEIASSGIKFSQGSPFYSFTEVFGNYQRGIVFVDVRNKKEMTLPFHPVYKRNTNIPVVSLYPFGPHTIVQVLTNEATEAKPAEWQMYLIPSQDSQSIHQLNEDSPVLLLQRSDRNWSHTISFGSGLSTLETNSQGKFLFRVFTLPLK